MTSISTIPQTTFGATAPTGSSNSTSDSASCQVTVPDYSVLRKQTFDKINNYYNTLLSSYTKNYSDYVTNSASGAGASNNAYAKHIQTDVENYNKQIINLSKAMINNVNQDNELITLQKTELDGKMAKIDEIMENAKLLEDKESEMTVLSNSRKDSLSSTKTSAEDMQFTTYVYIGICILLVLIIIGLIIYLVYSNYTVKSSNNNKNNNLYKNISVNNTL